MAWTPVLPGSVNYPEILLEWAPTTPPRDTPVWVDITDRLREWSWGYGRNDELTRFEAGTGSVVLDNRDRAFDPSYDAGTWFGEIKPRRMFRLRARWDSVIYPVFVAYARGFPQTYPALGADSLVKVDLVDAFAILQAVDLVVGFSRPAETTGERIDAVLSFIAVPAALQDTDAGTVTVDAVNITSPGTSGLDHAKQVALDSEMGQLFVAKDGKVTFHDYNRRLNASSLHTFTDDPAGALRYGAGFEPAYDETYWWNYIRVTGADNENAYTAEDATSRAEDFTITKPVSTQLVNASELQQDAERYALRYGQPQLRLPALPLTGANNPDALWPVILDLEVSDQIMVERFATSADPMTFVQNVEGIRHSCSPGGPWVTTVPTSPADTASYFTLDDPVLGELDAGNVLA